MNTQTLPNGLIDTDAQDHGEETRYAVEHNGDELHPEANAQKPKQERDLETPWQVD